MSLGNLERLRSNSIKISTGSNFATREYVEWCGRNWELSEFREIREYRELRE